MVIILIFNNQCNCTLARGSGYQGIEQILASYLAACKKQSRIIFYTRAATYPAPGQELLYSIISLA